MKYQNIPFFIATETVEKSKKIGKLASRNINTQYNNFDIPEIYKYLKNYNRFTCFIFDMTSTDYVLTKLVNEIHLNNPNHPIILISYENINLERYKYFIRMGVSDILILDQKKDSTIFLKEIVQILNFKWRAFLHTEKEKNKMFQASVVTLNHEINQPLTVILNALGLLKSELKNKLEQDIKLSSHLNFVAKSVLRIQTILDTLKKIKVPVLKEYAKDVWMVDLNSETAPPHQINRTKINNKNSILVLNDEIELQTQIESAAKHMGLYTIYTSEYKKADLIIQRNLERIRAVFVNANIPYTELKNLLYAKKHQNDLIPIIIIINDKTPAESIELVQATSFQILNAPIVSEDLFEVVKNSVVVK